MANIKMIRPSSSYFSIGKNNYSKPGAQGSKTGGITDRLTKVKPMVSEFKPVIPKPYKSDANIKREKFSKLQGLPSLTDVPQKQKNKPAPSGLTVEPQKQVKPGQNVTLNPGGTGTIGTGNVPGFTGAQLGQNPGQLQIMPQQPPVNPGMPNRQIMMPQQQQYQMPSLFNPQQYMPQQQMITPQQQQQMIMQQQILNARKQPPVTGGGMFGQFYGMPSMIRQW